MSEQIGRFMGFIGALLWHPTSKKYLLLKRSASRDVGAGSWECVTGRLNQGDGFGDALRREIYEELGVSVQVDFVIGTSHFYRGKEKAENEMIGLQYRCSLDDPDSIQLSHEHSESRWVTAEEAYQLLPDGHWLVKSIARAESLGDLLPPSLIDFNRQQGIEL